MERTNKRTDRQRNTLAARGLEELFFQLCYCVSFWFWWEIGFGFTYYLCIYVWHGASYAEDTSGYIVGTYNISD
jgi:hypothetical protein